MNIAKAFRYIQENENHHSSFSLSCLQCTMQETPLILQKAVITPGNTKWFSNLLKANTDRIVITNLLFGTSQEALTKHIKG